MPDQSIDHTQQAVIVYGPKGSGKTTHSKALAAHYGKTHIVDDFSMQYSRWKRVRDMPADTLFITSSNVYLDGPGKDSFVYIADACRAAGLTPHSMLAEFDPETLDASQRTEQCLPPADRLAAILSEIEAALPGFSPGKPAHFPSLPERVRSAIDAARANKGGA